MEKKEPQLELVGTVYSQMQTKRNEECDFVDELELCDPEWSV